MLCIKCKKEIPDGSKFCNHCGTKQEKKARRRADGRIEKSIVLDGKRKTFYGRTERDLNLKISEFLSQREKASSRTFAYYAEELERSWDSLAHNSLSNYRPALRRCVDAFGDEQVTDISALSIKLFLEKLGKTLSQKTVNTHKSMLTQTLNLAVLDGELQTNPAAVTYRATGKKKQEREAATEEQAQIIRDHWNDDVYSLLGYFLLNTGLRKGEALALQYKDIDFDSRRISVAKSVYYIASEAKIKQPKTEAGKRIVVLPESLSTKMRRGKPTEYVFSVDGKHPLSRQQIEKGWRDFCQRYNMGERHTFANGKTRFHPGVTFHQLRHYYATKCYEMGIDKVAVQAMMGHTNYGVTENYTHIREQSLKAAEALINTKDS